MMTLNILTCKWEGAESYNFNLLKGSNGSIFTFSRLPTSFTLMKYMHVIRISVIVEQLDESKNFDCLAIFLTQNAINIYNIVDLAIFIEAFGNYINSSI
jgi:hypothetical protein